MHQQSQSPLFALPAELRNRIYEHVAIAHTSNDEPRLLSTSCRVRREGLKLFYAFHIFNFLAKGRAGNRWDAFKYQHFLTSLGADRVVWIEHLRLQITIDYDPREGRKEEDVFLDVTLHAEKAEVVKARYSHDDVMAENVAALQTATAALNSAWAIPPSPTKAGLLRTLPALVPIEVEIGAGSADQA